MAHTREYLLGLSPVSHESECALCAFADPDAPTQEEVEARTACQSCSGFGRRYWSYWTGGSDITCSICQKFTLPVMASSGAVGKQITICLNCQLNEHTTYCGCGDSSWPAGDPP